MKNLSFKLSTLGLLLIFFSCQQDSITNYGSSVTKQELVQNDLIELILNNGFKLEDIKELDDYYLVENDIIFYKDQVYEKFVFGKGQKSSKGSKQSVTSNRVTNVNKNISVSLGTELNANWRNAATQAIAAWNNVCGVNFFITTSSTADIKINYAEASMFTTTSAVASAPYPNSIGKPGDRVRINYTYFENYSLQNSITAIVHELGHTIGLRHTNQFDSNIPGTPNNDSGSVMNSSIIGGWSSTGFSSFDGVAARYLFPLPTISASISGPGRAGNFGTYTWTANVANGTGSYTYSWSYNYNGGDNYESPWFNGRILTVSMPLDFDLYLKMDVKNSSGLIVATALRRVSNSGNNNGGHP